MVNTAFALKFTTPCKLASKCGIYHLCFWFTPSLHSFAPYLHRVNLCKSNFSCTVSSFCMYSLLQVYGRVHKVSFIFHLSVFLLSVCARGFGYLLCWPRGGGIGLVGTRGFSFHEFYNFLLLNFLNLIFFGRLFFTHDNHPHPRPLPTTHDI